MNKKRWQIAFIAAFLAFLMEYSLRGINGFLRQPAMAVLIFANYFTYLVLVEDFIGRFKLKDYQVWLVAQTFGLLWQQVSVAGVYYPPYVFGIGLGDLLINNLVWWTTIQTVYALYIGHRVVGAVDRSRPLLSRKGIFGFFSLYVLISASWRLFVTPPATAWQYLVIASLMLLFGWLSYREIRTNLDRGIQLSVFVPDKFLDFLAIFMVVYLLYSYFFLTGGGQTTHIINQDALKVNLVISPLLALALLVERLRTRKPIPV